MQYEAEVNGRLRQVAVHRVNGCFTVTVDGRSWTVDAVRISAHMLSMLVSERRESGPAGAGVPAAGAGASLTRMISHDVTITPDVHTGQVQVRVGTETVVVTLNGRRASRKKEEAGHSGAGPQRLLAPMPGKIVRLLVSPGDAVQARQPIAVIEAMKMENEIRAGRDGVVTELPVAAGQSVDAGTLVAVIAAQTG